MTTEDAIALAEECGWMVRDRTNNVDGGPGIYKVWVPERPGGHTVIYATYINTNVDAFAEKLRTICEQYVKEDDLWQSRVESGRAEVRSDVQLLAAIARATVDRTLEALEKAET